MDYYQVLEITKTASDEEIKKAYRKLAVQYHPDRNPGDKKAEDKFKEVNEAYQILSDPQKRSYYDQFGHAGLSGMGGFESNFTGSFTDIFDNIFGDIFGGGARQGSSGIDLKYNLEISFEEAAFGTDKKIHFEKQAVCTPCEGSGAKPGTNPVQCRQCKGSGQVRFHQGFFTMAKTCTLCRGRGFTIEEKCTHCRGAGSSKKAHTVEVKIPAGIQSEQRLRLKNEGEISEPGGRPGDLFVHIYVAEHAFFKRQDEHVILDLPISFVQATLGYELEVPTLSGPMKVKIPAGTQSGHLIHLKGKGIKRLNGSGHGEQIIRVTVEIPSKLTAKQKEILKEFEKNTAEDHYPNIRDYMKKTLLIILLLLLAVSCSPHQVKKDSSLQKQNDNPFSAQRIENDAKNLFLQAEKAYQSKNYDLAAKIFHSIRTKYPKGRGAMVSTYRIGSIYYQKEDFVSASREYEYFIRKYPSSDLYLDALYNYAASEHLLGNYTKCSQILNKMKVADILGQGPRRAEIIFSLMAQNAEMLKNSPDALLAYVNQYQLPMDEKQRGVIESKINSHLAKIEKRSELERLLNIVTEPSTKSKILAKLEAPTAKPPDPYVAEEAPPSVNTAETIGEKYRVGVILPLSGKWEYYGKKALDAILLAGEVFEVESNTPIQVFVEDSHSSPLLAAQAVENLYQKHKVLAIIGPFNLKEAQVVASKCQELGIINLSLSSKEGISKTGNFIFQNGLTPKVQLQSLAQYVVKEKEFKRFAILAPDSPFGKDMAFGFWDLIEFYGGQIVGFQLYPPQEKDFQAHTQELVGLANPRFRQLETMKLAEWVKTLKTPKGKENKIKLPPIVDFDAIFIPDSPKALAQIAPSLAFYDVNGVALLGTTDWTLEQLQQTISKLVPDALFPSAISSQPRTSKQKKFFQKYQATFEGTPDLLATQSFEAMELISNALIQFPTQNRLEMANYLAKLKNFETSMGVISMDTTRAAQRALPIQSLN
jgi:molecular chaperone DnaJ